MPGYGLGHYWQRPTGNYAFEPDQYCWYVIRYNQTLNAGSYGSSLTYLQER